jgi:hypothetical protein
VKNLKGGCCMKKVIGIRVTPKIIFYTIMEENDSQLNYFNEELIVPKALDVPRQLSYIRTTIFSLICEHNITQAGLRTAEGNATLNVFRLYIEGVIQELFSNSTVEAYFAGTLTSMASRLESTSTKLKECYKGDTNLYEIPGWNSMKENHRESFLAALAALRS